jgi:hypothetical protein
MAACCGNDGAARKLTCSRPAAGTRWSALGPGELKGHLDAVTERAAAPVIAKYTGGPALALAGPGRVNFNIR